MAPAARKASPEPYREKGLRMDGHRAGASHPHATQSPQILHFLAVSTGSVSAKTSRGRAGPGSGEFPGVAWIAPTLGLGAPPKRRKQEGTGPQTINLNSYVGSQRTR